MWNVPAVGNGPISTLPLTWRLLIVGAPGSLAGLGVPLTQLPLPRMCK